MISFTVQGNPLPKQSYRATKHGNFIPKRIRHWQDIVGWAAKEAMQGKDPMRGTLDVVLEFFRGDMRRVDLDNLSKAVLDAMNKIVYEDDRQINKLILTKEYDKDKPGVIISVSKCSLEYYEKRIR